MSPTSCSGCATPLPAMPADQRYPDRCAACAARAAGTDAGPPAPPPVVWGQPDAPGPSPAGLAPQGADPLSTATWSRTRLVVRTRHLDGALVGLATAGLVGIVWWAAVSATEMQFFYLAIALGFIVGHGTLIGARKGGIGPAVVAGLATLGALAVAEYFIERSLAISRFGADVPLWNGFEVANDVVRESLEVEPLAGFFWALAALAAFAVTVDRSRRPLI